MRSQDAQGVVNLYREIYGDHYPIREIYDPEFILKQHEKGLMVRAVVVDAGQNVLGAQALYRLEENYPGLYELGTAWSCPHTGPWA